MLLSLDVIRLVMLPVCPGATSSQLAAIVRSVSPQEGLEGTQILQSQQVWFASKDILSMPSQQILFRIKDAFAESHGNVSVHATWRQGHHDEMCWMFTQPTGDMCCTPV